MCSEEVSEIAKIWRIVHSAGSKHHRNLYTMTIRGIFLYCKSLCGVSCRSLLALCGVSSSYCPCLKAHHVFSSTIPTSPTISTCHQRFQQTELISRDERSTFRNQDHSQPIGNEGSSRFRTLEPRSDISNARGSLPMQPGLRFN